MTTPLFWCAVIAFMLVGGWLANGNTFPGGWDSENYLATARNVADGRGFVTDIVQDLVTPHDLPGPETVRAPGAVYVMALAFRVFGIHLGAMLFLNVLIVAGATILLRLAVRDVAPHWTADIAGLLMLASPSSYELSAWHNNNLLVLLVTAALIVATRAMRGSLRGWALALTCAALIAVGFLTKQTYILSFVPLTILLVGTEPGVSPARRISRLAAAGALSALLASPYWGATWIRFGTPLYSPIQQLRLPTRYLQTDMYTSIRTVHFGEPAATYRSIIAQLGPAAFLSRELANDGELATALLRRGGIALVVAAGALIFWRRRKGRLYAAGGCLLIAPIFDSLYWIVEERYLYPVFAVILFFAALGVENFRTWDRYEHCSAVFARIRIFAAVLLGITALRAAVEVPAFLHATRFQSRTQQPDWVETLRSLPADAVIMTSASPPHVNWWSGRRVIIEAIGTRDDLRTVLKTYRPTHYFDDRLGEHDKAPFSGSELTDVAHGKGWALYRIAAEATR